MNQVFIEVADDRYESQNGCVMTREKEHGMRWVLRAPDGGYLDHDQYRFDLMQRWDSRIKHIPYTTPPRPDAGNN